MAIDTPPEERLREQRRALPDQPGVYLFRDARGRVVYVGKAKSIRKRVASHFSNPTTYGTTALTEEIDHIEYLVVVTESEALLTEQNFIKQYKPKFNIRLRDDKSYPYIAISLDEDFPRVYFTREKHKRGRAYFGPYSSAKRVRGTLDLLGKIFLFRSCEGPEPGRHSGSPCLDYFIKRCGAPCVGYVSKEEYREGIDGVVSFLSGRFKQIEKDLERRMYFSAGERDYEQATVERNRLQAVKSLLEVALDLLEAAGQERHHAVDPAPVLLPGHVADAGRSAALDVVVQARRPGVAAGLRPLARAQLEDLAEQVERPAHALGARVGPEVGTVPAVALAREVDAREVLVEADRDVGVRLVVAQPDVEARLVLLDERLLGEQRLGLGRDDERLDVVDLVGERARAVQRGVAEVAGDALAQGLGLADVDHPAARVTEQVDAGGIGETPPLFREAPRAVLLCGFGLDRHAGLLGD